MDNILKTVLTAIVIGVVVGAIVALSLPDIQNRAGSVPVGGEYNVEHITSSDANSTSTLKTLSGSIGSITVTEVLGADISLYATTSSATSSNDLILSVDSAAVEGTYQYDARFNGGLLIDVPTGFTGNAAIMWR